MTRPTVSFLIAAAMTFSLAACDSETAPPDETRAAEPEPEPDTPEEPRGHHGPHARGKHDPAAKLCSELECSEDQAAEISALFASHGPKRDEAKREAHKAAKAEAAAKLAAAFRAEEFDPSVLEQIHHKRDRSEHEDRMVELALELHAILTPEQRTKLAARIAERGPMFFGRRHRGGKHHGHHRGKDKHQRGAKDGEFDPGAHAAKKIEHKVDKLCEAVTCSEEQRSQLSATFEGVHAEHVEARKTREKLDHSALAQAFAAETLDEAKLRAALAETRAEHMERKAEHHEKVGTVIAEIHAILTPEQRGIVADKIEAGGMTMLLGHRKRHRKGKRGRRGE